MKTHNQHYLVHWQLSLLFVLAMVHLSSSGLDKLVVFLPFAASLLLLYITFRLFSAIIRLLIPDAKNIQNYDLIHGSTLPVTVIYPRN